MNQYIERAVDLLDPSLNQIHNMSLEEARGRVLSGKSEAVREIDGSFALLARDGRTVRLARSMDRPMRYFLAKRAEGPALIVADRIDAIYQQLKAEGLHGQFHPSYTRMVPAHYVVPTPPTRAISRHSGIVSRRMLTSLAAATLARWRMKSPNG
jgi:asparagine synthase (glutamine-hydrolysing)